MDVQIRTGRTQCPRDTALVALSWDSESGERVCLLMQIHGKSRESKTLEKECSGVIQHGLLEAEGETEVRLDGTLKEINGLVKGMLVTGAIEDVHMLLAVLETDGALHVSHAGRGEAYVIRRGTASQITEHSKGRAIPAFVHIASGTVEDRDVIVLSSQRLLRALTPAQLSQISQHGEDMIDEITRTLESEKEYAVIGTISVKGEQKPTPVARSGPTGRERRRSWGTNIVSRASGVVWSRISRISFFKACYAGCERWWKEVNHPQKKQRAHMLLLAGVIGVLLIVWAIVQLTTSSQRGRTRIELKELVEQTDEQVRSADTRRLAGDTEAANAILRRAEEQAKQVMNNESGVFRTEALDLLDRIHSKQEEIQNISRLTPRVVVNLSTKNTSVLAQGLVGINDGEFVVFDRRSIYRVLLNALDDPETLLDEELIRDGTYFSRYQTAVFMTMDNSVVETIADQPVLMKTEDPAGWVAGLDIEGYLRYLYVLSPENNQIYKYERLSNRYSVPSEYNVNGDVREALDMTVDGNVYVLKNGGHVLKLLRGEVKPFAIRQAPEGVFEDVTKIFKSFDGNFYFLDPKNARIIVVGDSGASGEATYLKQFVLEGDQVGVLQDLYVDPDDTRLYVLDEKRLYVIDL